jgi:hypothetical protein
MSGFRTKLDYSDNRQIKQHPNTLTHLSGATTFGLPTNQLPIGPDLNTVGITHTLLEVGSLFSGNDTTTVYAWYDDGMQLGLRFLSAITPSNSGMTQIVPDVFTANTTTIIDGRTVVLSYSGVNYDLRAIAMYELGNGNYSGTVVSEVLNILSAATLDYTGRTIWVDVSGTTRTQDLIITNNASVGSVWTCVDAEGRGGWQTSSGSTTGGTSTQDNFVRDLIINENDLPVGYVEQDICDYILNLPASERTIAETDSKWNIIIALMGS